MYFKDRQDAGFRLARALKQYARKDLVIYALPRGGVVLGAILSKQLKAPLDLLIVRKIGHPHNPEYAVAAVAENGDIVENEEEVFAIDPAWFKEQVAKQQAEARRRRKLYMAGKKPIKATGKTCIIVDDGLATGLTMKAAIKELQRQLPKAIIVAVPIASESAVKELLGLVSDAVVLYTPAGFGAIGSYYQDFQQVSDEEVISFINEGNP